MSRKGDALVAKVAVALAVSGSACIGWLVFAGDDGESSAGTATTSTVVAPESSVAETTTSTATTTLETTTLPPPPAETVPAAPQPAAPSVADVPPIPDPAVFTGGGSHSIVSDPLPSGVTAAELVDAFAMAKRVADLLASGDWAGARTLLPVNPMSDDEFAFAWGPIERNSLLLLDAHPDGNGFQLLMVGITNEGGQQATSERCYVWYADASAAQIISTSVLHTYEQLLQPEDYRNNPVDMQRLAAECVWP